MGIYWGVYENPCPRCKTGRVTTVFISVGTMSSSIMCSACDPKDPRYSYGEYTPTELQQLGTHKGLDPTTGAEWFPPTVEDFQRAQVEFHKNLAFKRNKKKRK